MSTPNEKKEIFCQQVTVLYIMNTFFLKLIEMIDQMPSAQVNKIQKKHINCLFSKKNNILINN